MHKEEVLKEIEGQRPRILYISGKTCTGKTTFAREVERLGYSSIELDSIVNASVTRPFGIMNTSDAFITAYRDEGPRDQADAFIAAAHSEIGEKSEESPVVIEGAVAKNRILEGIFSGSISDFFFVYFHPVHLEAYVDRIRSRFIAGARDNTSGLPKRFWNLVQDADLKKFIDEGVVNEGIEHSFYAYAEESMKESQDRILHFKERFPNIHIVEI